MTTALAHGLVLTLDRERRILRNGTVAFDDGGTVVAVGPSDETLASLPADLDVVDCTGRVLTPGFVDAHVHLGEEVMRGLVPDDAPPDEWLPRWLLPAYAALTPDDERLSTELGIAQMLLTGTTTFCEAGTLLDWQAAADAVSETGIRGQLGRWTWDLPPEPAPLRRTTDEALGACEELVAGVRARGCDRLTGAVILLGIGTASPALLSGAAALSERLDAPLATMYASVAPEHGGKTLPLGDLGDAGWLTSRAKLTHVVYVSRDDVSRLADAGVAVAHCPTAALRHVKGIHRHGLVPEMLEQGIPVALGGDSANGSNHLDVLRLMYLAATLYKDFRMDPALIPPETALEMATLHGARALGLADQIGSLEIGKRADIVVFSTDHPEWRPLLHPVQNLVLNATDRSIESVWVDGRKLVDRGTLLTIDLRRLLERVDAAAGALLDRVGLHAPWAWPAR